MTEQTQELQVAGPDDRGVATVTLNRPAKRNALTRAMYKELDLVLQAVEADPKARVIVIRGEGPAFCAGADISDWADPGLARARAMSAHDTRVLRALAESPLITIAELHGAVMGGGLELALACDIRVAAKDARLGFPEIALGNLPGSGGVGRLVGLVGLGTARRLLLTSAPVSGAEAQQMGLVQIAVDPDDLRTATEAEVSQIVGGDPTAQALGKALLNGFERTVSLEPMLAGLTTTLESSRERKEAFLAARATRT